MHMPSLVQSVGAASAPPELEELADPLASNEPLDPPEEPPLDDVPPSPPPSCPPEEPPELPPELPLEGLPELPSELTPEELPPSEDAPESPPLSGVLPPPPHPSPTAMEIDTALQAFKAFIEPSYATMYRRHERMVHPRDRESPQWHCS